MTGMVAIRWGIRRAHDDQRGFISELVPKKNFCGWGRAGHERGGRRGPGWGRAAEGVRVDGRGQKNTVDPGGSRRR